MKNNGILLINKPECYTSRDIVNIVSKLLNTKKVGHTGTLDPLATGLLIICYGKYTKLVDIITYDTKEYITTFIFGYTTDTLDITGNVTNTNVTNITDEDIKKVLSSYIKTYKQEVPLYSAVKVWGKRLYKYAREEKDITLPVKEVTVNNLELLNITRDEYIHVTIKVSVSKGTYIRSLIRDIAISLNTYGVMSKLNRIKIGNISVDESNALEDLTNNNYTVYDIDKVLNIDKVILDKDILLKVSHGNSIKLNSDKDKILITDDKNNIYAIYMKKDDYYVCYKMLI